MKSWLSILGILLVGIMLFVMKSDWGQEQIRNLLGAVFGVQQPTQSQQDLKSLHIKPDGTLETPPQPLPSPTKRLIQ